MTRLAAISTILMVLAPALALAAEPGKSAAPPVALKLIVSKPVALECQTKSVVVAENAANATNGQLKLTLVLKNDTSKPATGSWRIAGVGPEHTGSLGGARSQDVCGGLSSACGRRWEHRTLVSRSQGR